MKIPLLKFISSNRILVVKEYKAVHFFVVNREEIHQAMAMYQVIMTISLEIDIIVEATPATVIIAARMSSVDSAKTTNT
jgi:hypothetical protein